MRTLFEEMKSGSEVAFSKVFKMWYSRLVFYADRLLQDEALAQDVAIEVLTKLHDEKHKLESEHHMNNFLYLIAKRKCIDVTRRKKTRLYKGEIVTMASIRGSQEDEGNWYENIGTEDEEVDPDWVYTQIIAIIAGLPPKYKEALMNRVDNWRERKDNIQYIRVSRARKMVIERYQQVLRREC